MPNWDPDVYLAYGEERGRPFFDLTSRVRATEPARVVDLGCGPGQLTATLPRRWPTAGVEGVDSSAQMIAAAEEHGGEQLWFTHADVADWEPDGPVDVIVSNALLQWVPNHRRLLPRLLDLVVPGGWLAFQVPGNLDEPSQTVLRDLAADARFADATESVLRPPVFPASTYLADLAGWGCTVDAWETTYLHVLSGPDPVYRWMLGTGARPILQALSDQQRTEFAAEYRQALRSAYPEQPFGTVLPFPRIFVVAQRPT